MDNLRWILKILPAQLALRHESLDVIIKAYNNSPVQKLYYFALSVLSNRIALFHGIPGILLSLLQTK